MIYFVWMLKTRVELMIDSSFRWLECDVSVFLDNISRDIPTGRGEGRERGAECPAAREGLGTAWGSPSCCAVVLST